MATLATVERHRRWPPANGRRGSISPPPTAWSRSTAGTTSSSPICRRACPGPEHHFLINPYDMMFEEITASSLVKIDTEGNPVGKSEHPVNPAGFTIHSAIHMARDDAAAVMHLHTPHGQAVSAMEFGLLPHTQTAMIAKHNVAYHDYEGIATDLEERERLVEDLGEQARDDPAQPRHARGRQDRRRLLPAALFPRTRVPGASDDAVGGAARISTTRRRAPRKRSRARRPRAGWRWRPAARLAGVAPEARPDRSVVPRPDPRYGPSRRHDDSPQRIGAERFGARSSRRAGARGLRRRCAVTNTTRGAISRGDRLDRVDPRPFGQIDVGGDQVGRALRRRRRSPGRTRRRNRPSSPRCRAARPRSGKRSAVRLR